MLIVGCLLPGAAPANQIVTRDHIFYIPFTAPADQMDEQFTLLVSGDRGQSWQRYQTQPASAQRFSFRAGVDGEFWFAVRVANPEQDPAAPEEPELIVCVDRLKPKLSLDAVRLDDGRIACNWNVSDDYLDPESLVVEFQWDGTPTWHSNIGMVKTPSALPTMAGGTAVIASNPDGNTVRIRATVRDRAGNESSSLRDYDPATLEMASPALAATLQDVTTPAANDVAAMAESMTSPRQLDSESSAPLGIAADEPPSATKRQDASFVQRPVQRMPQVGRDSMEGWRPNPMPANNLVGQQPLLPVDGSPNVGEQETNDSVHTPATDNAPSAALAMQRNSKSRKFELDYGVDVPREDIHRIEVWLTSDGGRSWQHDGDDEDKISPYLVKVDEDGLYGVRMLIQTKSGYTIRPPDPGESADVWIRVDSTPPVGRLLSVRYPDNRNTEALHITWQAQDDNLADHPVLLYASDNPNSGWRRISPPLPNVGQYAWKVDAHAPAQLYFRIEIRDAAGNVTTHNSAAPVQNLRAAPRSQILDVRPTALQRAATLRR